MVKKKKTKIFSQLSSEEKLKRIKENVKKFVKPSSSVVSKKVLRTPKQLKIVIKKQPVQTPRAIFFKQELIGAQNVLFGN